MTLRTQAEPAGLLSTTCSYRGYRPPGQLGHYGYRTSLMKDKKINIEVFPDHESGLRRMVSDAKGIQFQAVHSLDEAKSFADGIVVLEGDDGGQIYVVCPASLVLCSAETMHSPSIFI